MTAVIVPYITLNKYIKLMKQLQLSSLKKKKNP